LAENSYKSIIKNNATTILNYPIVKDWIKNKPNVHPNRLNIGSRNHWAKNETDFKILSVLGKTNQTI